MACMILFAEKCVSSCPRLSGLDGSKETHNKEGQNMDE